MVYSIHTNPTSQANKLQSNFKCESFLLFTTFNIGPLPAMLDRTQKNLTVKANSSFSLKSFDPQYPPYLIILIKPIYCHFSIIKPKCLRKFRDLGKAHYCLNNLSVYKVLKPISFASKVKHSL